MDLHFRSKDNKELYQALIDAWNVIGCWKSPSQLCAGYCDYFICESSKEPFKDAMILGDKNLGALIESHDLYIGIAYIHPGTTYPSHAHEPSEFITPWLGLHVGVLENDIHRRCNLTVLSFTHQLRLTT